jgi:DNA-binding transcriptional LysR family regulator
MLRRLQCFIVVAEEMNLRAAARRLGVSQPAVSAQLQSLEKRLGFDLLVRDQQRILGLTAAGALYLVEARRVLSEMDHAASAAAAVAAGRAALIRVGICEEVASIERLSVLCRMLSNDFAHIGVEFFEVPILHVAHAVRAGEIDLGLTVSQGPAARLDSVALWREPWVVVLPEQHPLAQRAKLSCSDLADVSLVLGHPELGAGAHFLIRDAFQQADVEAQVSTQVMRRSTLLTLVSAGMGASFVPAPIAGLRLPGLAMVPFEAPPMTVYAFSQPDPEPSVGSAIKEMIRRLALAGGLEGA